MNAVGSVPLKAVLLVLSSQALIHGLNRHYYSITINYRKNELEQKVCNLLRGFKSAAGEGERRNV